MPRLLPAVLIASFATLAACGHGSKASGPAWPSASKTADDGGESIEPHATATYAAAVERSAEPEPEVTKPSEAAAAAASSGDDDKIDGVPASSPLLNDDVLMTDEIIIEIED